MELIIKLSDTDPQDKYGERFLTVLEKLVDLAEKEQEDASE